MAMEEPRVAMSVPSDLWLLELLLCCLFLAARFYEGNASEEGRENCSPRPAQNVPIHTLAMIHFNFLGLTIFSSVLSEFSLSRRCPSGSVTRI